MNVEERDPEGVEPQDHLLHLGEPIGNDGDLDRGLVEVAQGPFDRFGVELARDEVEPHGVQSRLLEIGKQRVGKAVTVGIEVDADAKWQRLFNARTRRSRRSGRSVGSPPLTPTLRRSYRRTVSEAPSGSDRRMPWTTNSSVRGFELKQKKQSRVHKPVT